MSITLVIFGGLALLAGPAVAEVPASAAGMLAGRAGVAPFWQEPWFFVLCGALGVGAWCLRVRFVAWRRALREIDLLKQQSVYEAERTRKAYHDIYDDLGVSLAQFAYRCELLQGVLTRPEQACAHANELARSVCALSRTMDEIAEVAPPINDTAKKFAAFLGRFVEDAVRSAGLVCCLDLPVDLPALPMSVVVRNELYLVLREALSNVIRHAAARTVRFGLQLEGRRLQLSVSDDGGGFDLAQADNGVGLGLCNMEQRMTALGGTWKLASNPGNGTTITMEVSL